MGSNAMQWKPPYRIAVRSVAAPKTSLRTFEAHWQAAAEHGIPIALALCAQSTFFNAYATLLRIAYHWAAQQSIRHQTVATERASAAEVVCSTAYMFVAFQGMYSTAWHGDAQHSIARHTMQV
eukprot:4102940-Pyramimonas_sp.AAC.1